MKIEAESEFVIMKMTAMEAQVFHSLVSNALIDIRVKGKCRYEPEGDEANFRNTLSSFDDRLYDIFYKHQHN